MDGQTPAAAGTAALQGILGYLNFSAGKPDPRFQKQLDALYAAHDRPGAVPWLGLRDALVSELDALQARGVKGFADVTQARAALAAVVAHLLPAYRDHHRDLLFHQSDRELFQSGFLIRAFEAALVQGGPWDQTDRIVRGALTRLNEYVGYRPIAVLETRPRGEPYPHERLRAVPLYLNGAGALHGRYQALVGLAVDLIRSSPPAVLSEAYFDLALMDELAVDPRGYDHGHPADQRPNYRFGEWDPYHIDNSGNYRRFVVRQLVLDALLQRVHEERGPVPEGEALHEAAVVLAGTILMASPVSGSGPEAHDSTVTLSTLVPRIARNREAFYALQMGRISGQHRARLDRESATTRQPFGGVRQHINQFLAQHRAAQLQRRHLALVMAEMGYPEASRSQSAQIPVAGVRLLSEMFIRLTSGQTFVDRGEPGRAAALLPEVEALLRRGIDCGAVIDPWNILGFQGLFPIFTAAEDCTQDRRAGQLIHLVERTLNLYARVASESAAAGDAELSRRSLDGMRAFAAWWDKFATMEVGDVRHVHGGEAASSAEHVAGAMKHWRERGAATADLTFWRQHLDDFRSPKAFALVVEALLEKQDYRASLALLMSWLSHAEQVPLEDGAHSFHALALRWMLAVAGPSVGVNRAGSVSDGGDTGPSLTLPAQTVPQEGERWPLIVRFLDYLEANADEYWSVPRLDIVGAEAEEEEEDDGEDALYGAAYEDMTYRDSTDDDIEGEVMDTGPAQDFDLADEGERLEKRLRFLAMLARLWTIAARCERGEDSTLAGAAGSPTLARSASKGSRQETLQQWRARARKNYQGLLTLLEAVHEHPIAAPSGSYDSLVEYDRRNEFKKQLLGTIIGTCRDTAFAVGALQGAVEQPDDTVGAGSPATSGAGSTAGAGSPDPAPTVAEGKRPPWEPVLIRLERALWRGDAAGVRRMLPEFIDRFRNEPLLFTPLDHGGSPQKILRASIAQTILGALVANLPRLGLLRETYDLLRRAWVMEKNQQLDGPRVTEFDRLYQVGLQAVVEAVVGSAEREAAAPADEDLVELLERLTQPFASLWSQHSKTLRVSVLEPLAAEPEWAAVRDFIRRYGGDLFHARFLTLANLRGILHKGVGDYLKYLEQNPDALPPAAVRPGERAPAESEGVRLLDDLERDITRPEAERHLQTVLQGLVENYEEYKDYNTTTPHSDYGQNLYLLFDFLRLKAAYEREAWQLRPLALVHEVLARRRRPTAVLWQEEVTRLTRERAAQCLQQLGRLEREHGMRLRTVADRLQERFVKPLALDGLCALIEPAMDEARRGAGGEAFARFERELEAYGETTTGVGLDVPHWLRRLEAEIHRAQMARTAIASLAENMFQIPSVHVPLAELRRQFENREG